MAQNLLRIGHFTHSRVVTIQSAKYHNRAKVGNREVVGYGMNGEASYLDHPSFPMPAVRFQENKGEVQKLREKEKADWKKLSLDEKKALYRASFCQTYSEMKAPTGAWKQMIAGTLVAFSMSLWFYVWLKKYVLSPMPPSFSPESKAAQLQRMIDLRVNPIDGLASKWDYEKGRWKE